ncbi:MAG TPA: DUF1015 domain-containing protein [Ktedonobacterales bacterium]|jgi:uncharacterized protein (DUF1015 family)
MADVRPFPGIRYAPDLQPKLASLVIPPYDVISHEAQASYYERHPYNITRLELGRDEAHDDMLNNRYSRAAAALADWRMRGVLYQEAQPAFYLYQQHFYIGDKDYWRTGVLARVRLEPWNAGVVLPHEHTMASPKGDRLKLLRACAANLSPIMALYDDADGAMQRLLASVIDQPPQVAFTDEIGEDHTLLPLTDPDQIAAMRRFFGSCKLFIADGHHRYETALVYQEELREMRKDLHPEDAANFVLMSLIALEDPGLVILPTHRLVRALPADRISGLIERLSRYFTMDRLPANTSPDQALAELPADSSGAFILVMKDEVFRVRAGPEALRRMAETGRSAGWQKLDVAILQTLVLDEALGLNAEAVTGGNFLSYARDAEKAAQAVRSGSAQLAALMRSTPVEQLRNVALAGDRMPQKSTYFYPKLITGLVINPLW